MDLLLVIVRSAVTVALFSLFVLLCVWAWGKGRTAEFDAAARLPFDDQLPAAPPGGRPANEELR